ncbi:hypothetical protein PGT21_030717 [Puccinia graminis f. sp. tritici]|uniref:Uncharacterized protein n=1 Tax=Puccinia graminis f. sp. tritici TaxID=56615 RepID=A0A5B0S0R2_PUCGR|nr:hypothetical protein PGT21_030717 [Puccinia graminis f. sp. tritici]KAA1131332.1 hypothetical protein PGTUg99_031723 [Puccinia graminis f. sp. tritici]
MSMNSSALTPPQTASFQNQPNHHPHTRLYNNNIHQLTILILTQGTTMAKFAQLCFVIFFSLSVLTVGRSCGWTNRGCSTKDLCRGDDGSFGGARPLN